MSNSNSNDTCQVINLLSILQKTIDVVAALIALVPSIVLFLNESKIIIIVVVAGVCLAIAVILVCRSKALSRCLMYYLLNLTAPAKSYKLLSKEVIYEFSSRTKMRHEKIFEVKVINTSFRGINDKYKWTGDHELTVETDDPQHFKVVPQGSKFGLNRYNIEVKDGRTYSKGDKLTIKSLIRDIDDPNKKSSLHLSTGIYEKTERLKMRVVFDNSLCPQNARKLEYIHYNDDVHYRAYPAELQLTEGGTKKCYEWDIDKPLFGGKYMIEWEL